MDRATSTERNEPAEGTAVYRLIVLLLRRRWWLLFAALAGLLLAVVYGFLVPKEYESTAEMMPVTDDSLSSSLGALGGDIAGLASIAGLNLPDQSSTKDEGLEILRSRQFTLNFIRSNKLEPAIFPEHWDAATRRWDDDGPPTESDLYDRFDRDVRSVTERKSNGVISVAIRTRSADDAAKWANQLVDRLNAEMRQQELARAQASVDFLNAQYQKQPIVDVQEGIARLLQTQLSRLMVAEVRKEFAFRLVDPARPSDPDDYEWPNWPLLIILGPLLGLLLAASSIIGIAALRTMRREYMD